MGILTLKEDLQQPRAGDYAACADLMMSFSQLGLSEEVQRFHCYVDEDGQWWAFTVALMAERYVPELMELVTDVLSSCRQCRRVRQEVERDMLRTKTHIDNARFLHPNPFVVNEALQQFLANCRHVGAIVNDDPLPQTPHFRNFVRCRP